jgi:hypothetical protein
VVSKGKELELNYLAASINNSAVVFIITLLYYIKNLNSINSKVTEN